MIPTRSALGSFVHVAFAAAIAAAVCEGQSTASLTLVGLDGTTTSLGIFQLQALPQVEHTDSGPNGVTRYRGPSLRALAGAPEGRALRGPSMTIVVLAEATDGYKVAYALAELDEQFGARKAFVALTQNGESIGGNEGPLRVVLPGEVHRARWIRQLSTLRLLRAGESP